MAEVSFTISDKLADKLLLISSKLNCTIDDVIEEAVLSHFNISLIDINSDTPKEDVYVNHPYYVYAYLDPRFVGEYKYDEFVFNHIPIYIGKGTGDRMNIHGEHSHNETLASKIEELKLESVTPIIVTVKSGISSHEAYMIESRLINRIGRSDIGTGPLLNRIGGIRYTDDLLTPTPSIESMKLEVIVKALNKYDTIKEAAEELGLSERTLYRKIKNCNIRRVNQIYIFS